MMNGKRGLFLVGVLTELYQSANSGFGVQESDVEAFSALAGSFVDKLAAFFFGFGQSVGHAVLDSKSYVLDATATAVP